ncbi:hypothetical protein MNQ95_00725 [Pseudoxanthomonas daejeonensis]|uniref:hypothetical protein n=1 Tax=Pseudoxanthomonas daejeonensis TaxID=266062 RepID=UPI001F54766F|nr:hypothetical protein [Pseudoxanthomonas daejeonensis]UNK57684.1 hypothetical protein MNQ95_00725 [Pseudoxanthomonas daejeonensis]
MMFLPRNLLALLAIVVPAGALASDAADRELPAMSGTFFGSVPLAGCAHADALLRLGPDRRYAMQAHCRTTLEDLPLEQGDWSVEWNGTCVRLVPDGLAGAREFAVALDDLLVLAEGSCIEPVEDPRGRSLHRAQPTPWGR